MINIDFQYLSILVDMWIDYGKEEIKALVKGLENKDLKEFVEGIANKQDELNQNRQVVVVGVKEQVAPGGCCGRRRKANENKEGANNIGLNPLLLAAEYGCHKILKQIVDLGDGIREYEQMSASIGFKFSDCYNNGENFLLLGSYN